MVKSLADEKTKKAAREEIETVKAEHKRSQQVLESSLTKERQQLIQLRKRLRYCTSTSRSYFDRWQWEAKKRNQAELRELQLRTSRYRSANVPEVTNPVLHEIQPTLLKHPKGYTDDQPRYLGQGSFGVVKHQQYRDYNVAVKEFRDHTKRTDVHEEAWILSKLSHPNVPYLFGVCTKVEPFKLVMQLHAIYTAGELKVHTFSSATKEKGVVTNSYQWLALIHQAVSGLVYLHEEVQILHNDIKADNLLITAPEIHQDTCINSTTAMGRAIVVDFGKACAARGGRWYRLTATEKALYYEKHTHIAPELIEGQYKQSQWSDIYSLGMLMFYLKKRKCLINMPEGSQAKFTEMMHACCKRKHQERPLAKDVEKIIQNILSSMS